MSDFLEERYLNLFDFCSTGNIIKQFNKAVVDDNPEDLLRVLSNLDADFNRGNLLSFGFLNNFISRGTYPIIRDNLFDVFSEASVNKIKNIPNLLDGYRVQNDYFSKVKLAFLEKNKSLLEELISQKDFQTHIKKDELIDFINNNFNSEGFDVLYQKNILNNKDIRGIFKFIDEASSGSFVELFLSNENRHKFYYLAKHPEFIKRYFLDSLKKMSDDHIESFVMSSHGFKDLMFKSFIDNGLIKHQDILKYVVSLAEGFFFLEDKYLKQCINLYKESLSGDGAITLNVKDAFYFNKEQLLYMNKVSTFLNERKSILDVWFYLKSPYNYSYTPSKRFLAFCKKNNTIIYKGLSLDIESERNKQDLFSHNDYLFMNNFYEKHAIDICKVNLINLMSLKGNSCKQFYKKLNFKSQEVGLTLCDLLINQKYSNNLLLFVPRMPSKRDVDAFIWQIKPLIENSIMHLIMGSGAYEQSKDDEVFVDGKLFLIYLAIEFGSKMSLKKILKDNDYLSLIKNNGVYDEVMTSKDFSGEIKQVFANALAKGITNNLNKFNNTKEIKRKLKI